MKVDQEREEQLERLVSRTLQDQPLRTWARENPFDVSLGQQAGSLRLWFSPNTKKKTKDAKVVPADMAEVFDLIDKAKWGVLFLLFNPGTPSIVERVKKAEKKKSKEGKPLYVRGAISDAKTAAEGSVRFYSRSTNAPADIVVTGVAGDHPRQPAHRRGVRDPRARRGEPLQVAVQASGPLSQGQARGGVAGPRRQRQLAEQVFRLGIPGQQGQVCAAGLSCGFMASMQAAPSR